MHAFAHTTLRTRFTCRYGVEGSAPCARAITRTPSGTRYVAVCAMWLYACLQQAQSVYACRFPLHINLSTNPPLSTLLLQLPLVHAIQLLCYH